MSLSSSLPELTIGGSPFSDGAAPPDVARPSSGRAPLPSPFLSEDELESSLPFDVAGRARANQLSFELHDARFDEAIEGLTRYAVARVQGHRHALPEGEIFQDTKVERLLRDELAPLARAGEALLSEIARRSESLDLTRASEAELDALFEAAPIQSPEPSFEQFLSGLWSKAKKVAGAAVSLAKKGAAAAIQLGLGPVLARLKALVRPLLEKVLAFALDKVPASYRPAAQALAARFLKVAPRARATSTSVAAPERSSSGGAGDAPIDGPSDGSDANPEPSESGSETPSDAPVDDAAPDLASVQEEVDGMLGEVLLGGDANAALSAAPAAASLGLERLHAARQRLGRELLEGEAGPAVEQFLPALLPVLRLGVKLAGRPRVVGFLGGLLGKLISPLTGASVAPRLGALIADIGLRTFLQSELADTETSELAEEALVHTVEETVRSVAQLPEHVLDHEALLESHVLDAFDRAARQHLPSSVFKGGARHPASGLWVSLPRKGPRYFKKWSHPLSVAISPQLARVLPAHGGGHLASYLRDRLQLGEGESVSGQMELFELLPGGRQAHVLASESKAGRIVDLHPLTSDAALGLLGKPGLGRTVPGGSEPGRPRTGERFYALSIEGAKPKGHVSRLRVHIDPEGGWAEARLVLGEPTAQEIAALLRKRARPALILARLRTSLGRARVTWPRGTQITPSAHRALTHQVRHWMWSRLSDHLEKSGQEFVRAADAPELGVTVVVRIPELARHAGATTPAAEIRVLSGAQP